MPCRFASSGTVATSRSASRAILALNVASNFLRDLVISVLHRLRQSRTLHTLTFGPISGVHFNVAVFEDLKIQIHTCPWSRATNDREARARRIDRIWQLFELADDFSALATSATTFRLELRVD